MGNQFPAGGRRVTIQDIAVRAGVTKGTVSKFLNARPGYYVADTTRTRIEDAIRELDFQPSAIAQGLSHNRTMTIGFVAADIRNPFYPDLVAGVQTVVEQAGYTLVLGSSGSDSEREYAILRSMIRRRVDGVILGSARMQASEIELLARSGIRVVLASRNLPELVADTVIIDNVAGGELATTHLIELGHRRIGHIAGPLDVVPFIDRMTGYKAALATVGIPVDETLITSVRSSSEEGRGAAHQLLARSDRPTALFVANDNMALGAMDAAKQLGLRIPQDVSIVGFDNISLARNSFISLTTIDSQAQHLGEEAARVLLARLSDDVDADRADDAFVLTVHPPILRVRGSSAAPLSPSS
jgi:DNA-binding LacI/PurR family transcriptional regulator